jgi:hypothetical protein
MSTMMRAWAASGSKADGRPSGEMQPISCAPAGRGRWVDAQGIAAMVRFYAMILHRHA